MSTGNSTTMTGRRARSGPPPTQKLKDSCDMCSSSKVKCNKEKPVCSRCWKLGYPCFYSPARRIGRPHPNRRTIARKSPETLPTHSRTESSVNKSAPNKPRDSQTLGQDPRPRLETQPSIYDEYESSSGATYGPNALHWLDGMYTSTGGLETSTTSAMNCGSYVFHDACNQKQNMSVPQSPLTGLDLFNLSDALNGDLQWIQTFQNQSDSNLIPLEFSPVQNVSQGSSAATPDFMENISSGQSTISDSSEPDCVIGAIDILRRLQGSNSSVDETTNSSQKQELPARVQTAAWAVNRLSTILVCPCSRKIYVGILVATVCMAIMDTYDSLFYWSYGRKDGNESIGRAQGMDQGYSLGVNVDRNECIGTECAESADFESDKGEPRISSVHILEELSKLANVVMQFAYRYKGDSCAQPVGTLTALADTLKLRLRSITNEAFEKAPR